MLLVVDAGNTNIVFAVHDGNAWRGTWRIATEPQRTSDEYAVWLLALLGHSRLASASRWIARGDRHRGAGGALPSAPPVPRLVRRRAADRPRQPRLGVRDPRGQPRGGRRRPAAERAGRRTSATGGPLVVIDFGTATTFDVVDRGRRLSRRRDRAGHQPVHRGAAPRRRPAAAHRHRPAAGGDRPVHRAGHAVRHLLGLCRHGRGAGRAHPGRIRRQAEGDRAPAAWRRCSPRAPL